MVRDWEGPSMDGAGRAHRQPSCGPRQEIRLAVVWLASASDTFGFNLVNEVITLSW